jgi:hypothetical protein
MVDDKRDTDAPPPDTSAEDETLLAPLRAKYPNAELQLLRIDKRVGPVVLRTPTVVEYTAYTRSLADDNSRHVAGHNLFVSVCVHPANPGSILERFPGFLHNKSVQRALAYLAGATSESEGKS